MRKLLVLATVLLLVPAAGSAQQNPDTTRADRPLMRGRVQDMAPEMRRAYEQGFRDGRMAAQGRMRGGQRFAPGARGQVAPRLRGQARPGFRGGMAARSPGAGLLRFRGELNLTEDQVKRLEEIRERQREQHRAGMDARRKDREQWLAHRERFREQTRALMLDVLTAPQKQKLEELEKQPLRRGRM